MISFVRSFSAFILCAILLSACLPAYLQKLDLIREREIPLVREQMRLVELYPGDPVHIRIFKEEAALEVWVRHRGTGRYALYKTYPICAFSGTLGPKLREGDHQAPEGFYSVTQDWLWPQSKYHLAMNIAYPNEFDKSQGRTGSAIMIHGACESEGCYAMTDPGIEEIYVLVESALENGQTEVPVHIFPFHMTPENMIRHRNSKWLGFWYMLKEGHDHFIRTRVPPAVGVYNGQYIFGSGSTGA